MSLPVSRTSDIGFGVCSAHKYPIVFITTLQTGAFTVLTNGRPTAILGSIGISSCGHTTVAILGSPLSFAGGFPIHRVTDIGMIAGGTYSMILGSPNTFAG